MKIAYLHNTPPAQHISNEEKFIALGKNTGNLVFRDALWRLFDPFNIPYDRQEFIEQFEKVIITDLIWIKENAEYNYLERIIDKYPVSLIPMSIGLQNKSFYDLSFRLSEQLVRLLKKMQERAVLGCRGEYTAEVLSKNGIKNIEMIGCPSMYYWNNRRLKIRSRAKPVHCSANFRSFSRALTENEKNFLRYCAERNMVFIEQTGRFAAWNVKDKEYFQFVNGWMEKKAVVPFDRSEWDRALQNVDFSFGARFHGNVMALWNNIKALFMITDSRTKEMIEFFRLPSIELNAFDKDKPIEYYYELADYSEFNKIYHKLYKIFCGFVKKNGLVFSEKALPLQFNAHKVKVQG